MNRVTQPLPPGNLNSRNLSRVHSDGEGNVRDRFYSNKLGNLFPFVPDNEPRYARLPSLDFAETDPEEDDKKSTISVDEFGENQNYANRLLRTGRQRKKLAARSKGGEFRQRRKKRRLYFCCLSSEIDVQKLFDHLVGAESLSNGWKYQLHADVLHLYKAGIEEPQALALYNTSSPPKWEIEKDDIVTSGNVNKDDGDRIIHASSIVDRLANQEGSIEMHRRENGNINGAANGSGNRGHLIPINSWGNSAPTAGHPEPQWSDYSRISGIGAQEIFVFDFGSAVFWGFSRGEETNLLKTIRMFVTKGFVGAQEFQSGEDDMAFVCVPTVDTDVITIANDVITIPDDTTTKQRMSVSFAIAQSTVLAIFEARVELKVEDYRYIPETLAASGKVQLSERQLGMMIGDSCSIFYLLGI